MEYNFLGDNFFVVYESADSPNPSIQFPLMDSPLELDWASGITKSGVPIVRDNVHQKDDNKVEVDNQDYRILNNTNEYTPIQTDNNSESQQQQQNYSKSSNNNRINKETNKAQTAMNFFISKGLSKHAAAGIIGNLMVESNLKTNIKGDGGKAFGLAQWHPDRQIGLKALAKKFGTDVSDFNTQLEYIWQELNTTHKSALQHLLKSTNSKEATIAFMRHFEKPGKPNLQKRINFAISLG